MCGVGGFRATGLGGNWEFWGGGELKVAPAAPPTVPGPLQCMSALWNPAGISMQNQISSPGSPDMSETLQMKAKPPSSVCGVRRRRRRQRKDWRAGGMSSQRLTTSRAWPRGARAGEGCLSNVGSGRMQEARHGLGTMSPPTAGDPTRGGSRSGRGTVRGRMRLRHTRTRTYIHTGGRNSMFTTYPCRQAEGTPSKTKSTLFTHAHAYTLLHYCTAEPPGNLSPAGECIPGPVLPFLSLFPFHFGDSPVNLYSPHPFPRGLAGGNQNRERHYLPKISRGNHVSKYWMDGQGESERVSERVGEGGGPDALMTAAHRPIKASTKKEKEKRGQKKR